MARLHILGTGRWYGAHPWGWVHCTGSLHCPQPWGWVHYYTGHREERSQ